MGTTVILEKPLIKVYSFEEVPWRYDELSREEKRAYDSLHHWAGIDSDRIYGIFKTNRYVSDCACGRSLISVHF